MLPDNNHTRVLHILRDYEDAKLSEKQAADKLELTIYQFRDMVLLYRAVVEASVLVADANYFLKQYPYGFSTACRNIASAEKILKQAQE